MFGSFFVVFGSFVMLHGSILSPGEKRGGRHCRPVR
jgi:hypothetical protein